MPKVGVALQSCPERETCPAILILAFHHSMESQEDRNKKEASLSVLI